MSSDDSYEGSRSVSENAPVPSHIDLYRPKSIRFAPLLADRVFEHATHHGLSFSAAIRQLVTEALDARGN